MTVRELLEVIGFEREIFIKPSGKRIYFEGTTFDVPESLMESKITEIVPQIYKETDPTANRKFYWGLGIWVEPIREFDAMYDGIDDYLDYTAEEIDGTYCFVMEDRETRLEELEEMAIDKRKDRMEKIYKKISQRREKTLSLQQIMNEDLIVDDGEANNTVNDLEDLDKEREK